jgi:hypothetical protein
MPESDIRSSIKVVVPELSDLPRIEPEGRDWSDFEIAYLEKFYPQRQFRVIDIAKCLGRSVDSVDKKAWKIGLRRRE